MTVKTPILLLGPVRTGKTTLAKLLASQLKFPHISLDQVRWRYYREIGYDADLANQIRTRDGFLALVFYRQLFDPYAVERVLTDYPQAVIDFGAGVGPYENREHFNRVQRLLEPIPNIFLILPSPDINESLTVLRQRDTQPPADLHFDINAHFLHHPGYQALAKHTIYNHARTPAQSSTEILELMK